MDNIITTPIEFIDQQFMNTATDLGKLCQWRNRRLSSSQLHANLKQPGAWEKCSDIPARADKVSMINPVRTNGCL